MFTHAVVRCLGLLLAQLVILIVKASSSFFFVGLVVNDLPPLTIVTLRVGIAAVVLWLIVFMNVADSSRPIGHRWSFVEEIKVGTVWEGEVVNLLGLG